jgi:hypothetical protein
VQHEKEDIRRALGTHRAVFDLLKQDQSVSDAGLDDTRKDEIWPDELEPIAYAIGPMRLGCSSDGLEGPFAKDTAAEVTDSVEVLPGFLQMAALSLDGGDVARHSSAEQGYPRGPDDPKAT